MDRRKVIGYFGKDPELKMVKGDIPVLNFSLGVRNSRTEDTEWVQCVAWRGRATTIAKHCKKGDKIFVEGGVKVERYETKNGEKREVTKVEVDTFEFMSGRKKDSDSSSPTGTPQIQGNPSDERIPLPDLDDFPPF